MIRATVVLVGILMVLQSSDAIKCYDCNSLNNSGCSDEFRNFSTRILDCAQHQQQQYDLRPIENCRKIKYKENGAWIYIRGCDSKDNSQIKNAEYHYCKESLCNSADIHRPTILFTLMFISFLFIKLMRFY
ncbi:uncharacterized protein LOC116339626 [Contarinia nasturtii]|uniref:uncharacterized protein LOC116339626 n=1 Tax=Contarinia nasturtii TaxID=265458 RepID=UPI0012D391C6|nr:uncharacterized protein LOC116339626 [Contarinia nasturtii]